MFTRACIPWEAVASEQMAWRQTIQKGLFMPEETLAQQSVVKRRRKRKKRPTQKNSRQTGQHKFSPVLSSLQEEMQRIELFLSTPDTAQKAAESTSRVKFYRLSKTDRCRSNWPVREQTHGAT